MAKIAVNPANLDKAIRDQLLSYNTEVNRCVTESGEKAIKKLVKLTKASAPKATGSFRKNISWKMYKQTFYGSSFAWYVKKPDHRITHLLVHGHATRDGGRVKGDEFLNIALDTVLPEYENDIREALENVK